MNAEMAGASDPRGSSSPVGWRVYDWAGTLIGEIEDVQGDTLIVRTNSIDPEPIGISREVVSDEDAEQRRVTLSVDRTELDVDLSLDGVSLVDDADA